MGGENSAQPSKGNEVNHPNITRAQAAEISKLEAAYMELMELLCSKPQGMSAAEVEKAIKLFGQCQESTLSAVHKASMEASTPELLNPSYQNQAPAPAGPATRANVDQKAAKRGRSNDA